jgi:hypothetical protein
MSMMKCCSSSSLHRMESTLNRLLGWSLDLEQMYTPKVIVRDVGTLTRFVFVQYEVYPHGCYSGEDHLFNTLALI